MTTTALNPASVPSSPFHSQAIEVRDAGRLVFISGQVGMTADGSVPDGGAEQAAQAVANLGAVLEEAGLTPADLVKLTIYLTDPADVEPFVGAVAGTLSDPPPATTMLIVSALGGPGCASRSRPWPRADPALGDAGQRRGRTTTARKSVLLTGCPNSQP